MAPPPYPGQGIIMTIIHHEKAFFKRVLIIVIRVYSDDHVGGDVYGINIIVMFSI